MRSLVIWIVRLGLLAVAAVGVATAGDRMRAQIQQTIDAAVDTNLPPVPDGDVLRDAGIPLRQ